MRKRCSRPYYYSAFGKKGLIRLVVSYLGALIPVLLISFVLSESTFGSLQSQARTAGEQRMGRAAENLSSFFSASRRNATQFSNTSALRPIALLQTSHTREQGVELLRSFVTYDANVSEIVIDYGTDWLYCSQGISRPEFFFGTTCAYTELSTRHAIAALSSGDDCMVQLDRTNGKADLLLHYVNRTATAYTPRFSVNFMVTLDQFTNQLQELLDPTLAYVAVTLPDSASADGRTTLCFRAAGDALARIDPADYPTNLWPYTATTSTFALSGMHGDVTVTALQNTGMMLADVRRSQTINYALLGVGMLLSALLAYIFSHRRARQLSLLETMLQSGVDTAASGRGELAELQGMVRSRLRENRHLETKSVAASAALRCQTALLLFHRWVQDETVAEQCLHACGLVRRLPCYAVGGVLFPAGQAADTVARMERLLAADLSYRADVAGRTALFFFTELPDGDPAQCDRLTLGRHLQEVLVDQEVPNARVGLSAVHQKLAEACLAFDEAHRTLEYFAQRATPPGQCMCWEDVPPAEMPDEPETTDALLAAVRDGRSEDAVAELMRRVPVHTAAPAPGETFRRAQLLTHIGDALPAAVRAAYWKEAAEAPLDNAGEFLHHTQLLLQRYVAPPAPHDLFSELSAYVNAHYTDGGLTVESVAATANITPQYLTRLFKARAGLSYIDYLTQLRMKHACMLLRTTTLSVQEVVQRSGYLDASSFRRKFKSIFGVGVNEYRALAAPPPLPPHMLPFDERK